jgi:hypothetical protein
MEEVDRQYEGKYLGQYYDKYAILEIQKNLCVGTRNNNRHYGGS